MGRWHGEISDVASLVSVQGLRPGCAVEIIKSDKQELVGQCGQLLDYSAEKSLAEVLTGSGQQVWIDVPNLKPMQGDAKPGFGGGAGSFDVLLGPKSVDSALGEEIADCLVTKGFCVVKLLERESEQELASTLDVVKGFSSDGKLSRLPEEVEEGYLGTGMRGRVMWLNEDQAPNEALDRYNEKLSNLANILQPHSQDVAGQYAEERTPALVSLSLPMDLEDEFPCPVATDRVLGDYLQTWRRSLFKVMHFLGPSTTGITLEKRDSAPELPMEQDMVSFEASPNTVVIFSTASYSLACDIAEGEEVLTMSTYFLSVADQWFLEDLEGTPADFGFGTDGPSPPKGESIHVLNLVTKLPTRCEDADQYRSELLAGNDAAVEIPCTRFDVHKYWCQDPDTFFADPNRTIQRHMSYVDGIDLFDHRAFDISIAEARQMGPLQRMVIEVGGASLALHGITKKVSNRTAHHAGLSVGMDKDDWVYMQDLPLANQGGQNVVAIIANRFSYVFNLKGPSFVADTACSASLVATHCAKLMLLERKIDPLEFHVALGTHLCFSIVPFIGTSSGQMSSAEGRCFTFNATATGYLRGEGTSGMLLKYGGSELEGSKGIYRASQIGQDGRSASLNAPSGPAQEQMIKKAIQEAGIIAPESTAWECHGTGTALGDPIEIGAVRKVQVKMAREEPLCIASVKANLGHLEGGAAMAGMVKSILQVSAGVCMPHLQLAVLNPHLEHETFDARYMTECVPFANSRAHCQVSSLGFGGTNGHVVFWGCSVASDSDIKNLVLKKLRTVGPPEVVPYGSSPDHWESGYPPADARPGDKYRIYIPPEEGKGSLQYVLETPAQEEIADDGATDSFMISGNFNNWTQDLMTPGELVGVYTFTARIQGSGTLEFRFVKNGEPNQVICPSEDMASKKSVAIVGPGRLANRWCINGTEGDEVSIELFARQSKMSILWFVRKPAAAQAGAPSDSAAR